MSPERAPFSSLSFPVGPLGIIAMDSCKEIAQKVDAWLLEERHGETGNKEGLSSFFINSRCPDSVTERQKRLLMNQSEVKIFIFFVMLATIVLHTILWAIQTICHRTITLQTLRELFLQ